MPEDDLRVEETVSEHVREFRAKFGPSRRGSAREAASLWEAIFDLAGQISTNRHDLANMKTGQTFLFDRLFGAVDMDGTRHGGEFEEIKQRLDSIWTFARGALGVVLGAVIIFLGALLVEHVR